MLTKYYEKSLTTPFIVFLNQYPGLWMYEVEWQEIKGLVSDIKVIHQIYIVLFITGVFLWYTKKSKKEEFFIIQHKISHLKCITRSLRSVNLVTSKLSTTSINKKYKIVIHILHIRLILLCYVLNEERLPVEKWIYMHFRIKEIKNVNEM